MRDFVGPPRHAVAARRLVQQLQCGEMPGRRDWERQACDDLDLLGFLAGELGPGDAPMWCATPISGVP
jgi:hypothetical protein